MARSQDPNSASAQFYVALNDLPELDGRYAVFGKVIEGMPVIDRIMQGDRLRKAEVLQVGT
jgi:peptidyl-prolyl cis-trans isomerase B (cyclophilin B)